jgi:hypothetical protein
MRRFGLWDYLATAATLGSYYAVEFGLDGPSKPIWTRPVPVIDAQARELFALDSRSGRRTADAVSDYAWYGTTVYPVVAALAAPLARGKGADFVWQLSMMNLQAYAAASLLVRIPHRLIGRTRPAASECERDPGYSNVCGTDQRYVSFYGGHTTIAMTGAGLSCAHHLHAELFGDPQADRLMCAAALTLGGVAFVTRMQADKHWLSDQLVSVAVGLGVGYGLPTLLYYHPLWGDDESAQSRDWMLAPMVGEGSVGASWLGRF